MAELKNIRISEIRLHFSDGSSVPIAALPVTPGPNDVKFLWFRRAIVPGLEVEGSVATRLDLGRFLRTKSLSSLLRSLDRVTHRWPWSECEKVCREVAARIFARGAARVQVLTGREGLDEQSFGDLLVGDLRRMQFDTLAPVPPTSASDLAFRFWRDNIRRLALRWSEPEEDDAEVLPRLEFLTDPLIQQLPLEERARRLQQRFGLAAERARQYADAVSLPDGPLAVFAYLWVSGHWEDDEETAPVADWHEGWERTTWGRFLVARVLPNYPIHRALESRLRRALWGLRKTSRDVPQALAQVAILRAVTDIRGLDDYLNSYWGGPYFHGGKYSHTWSARLRKYQRQAVKDEVEPLPDRRHISGAYQVEDLPAPDGERFPDLSGVDLSVLLPAERQAVEEAMRAAEQGYYRHSKRGTSLKDFWGPDYAKRQRALKRAQQRLKRSGSGSV